MRNMLSSFSVVIFVSVAFFTSFTSATVCTKNMTTPPTYSYQQVPSSNLSIINNDSISFSVKICNDAIVLLSDSSNYTKVYEIVIGGGGNTKSVIRKARISSSVGSVAHTPVSCTQWRSFYIKWHNGIIEVGNVTAVVNSTGELSFAPFLVYVDPLPTSVAYIFVSGWNAAGEWRFDYPCQPPTTSSSTSLETSGYQTTSSSTSLETSGYQTTSSSRSLETSSYQTTSSSRSLERSSYQTTSSSTSLETSSYQTTSSSRSLETSSYQTPSPRPQTSTDAAVHSNNACTINVTSPGNITYQQVAPSYLLQKGDNTSKFAAKVCKEAYILLSASNSSDDTHVYEIVLGGWNNTHSFLRRSKQGPNVMSVAQNNSVSCTDWRHFYFKYQNGVLEVGNITIERNSSGMTSSLTPFMTYIDPMPFAVSYVFVATSDCPGEWGFDYTCPLNSTSVTSPVTSGYLVTSAYPPMTSFVSTGSTTENNSYMSSGYNTCNTTNIVTVATVANVSSSKTERHSLCTCRCVKSSAVNLTSLLEIVDYLTLDRQTSLSARKYISVYDRRPSSATIGVIAIFCGIAPLVFCIVLDIISIWQFVSMEN